MAQYTRKEKSIKDLELISKKLKRRISILEKFEAPSENSSVTSDIVTLVSEYRRVKRDIVELDFMKAD